jgi:hypothetical protein
MESNLASTGTKGIDLLLKRFKRFSSFQTTGHKTACFKKLSLAQDHCTTQFQTQNSMNKVTTVCNKLLFQIL